MAFDDFEQVFAGWENSLKYISPSQCPDFSFLTRLQALK